MDDREQTLAERAAEIMGYPATAELVLSRVKNPMTYPNLIDALWQILTEEPKLVCPACGRPKPCPILEEAKNV